ncbi:Glu/Leu/Phe/Val family dehydrogenase [Nocardia sp. alder85J]|uniref:Glu/Leu/Phe/Val family dehydrogenase n=1 Tax=Nocardia sp. alder85J TaxID=2862949 RepID=UPI001CD29811|nr:Glu/Leu/Phe/Val dehydrogenase dimerization domain-containing protein [Nocardia sp. alder85J]MCX4094105.1 valine dehydrogenase [Nocardia sp. alder85J]
MFDSVESTGHEQVVFCRDPASGLRSIIAVHDTTLGPGIGGVRMWNYPDEQAALTDVLRLSQGMTYKAAIAGVDFGGAKSVILGDPGKDKTEALLRAHGRFVQSLGGRYIPGVDVGTSQPDMDVLALEAKRVFAGAQDPSPLTALGVLEAIRAAVADVFGAGPLADRHVAVQGVGHVGAALVRLLAAEGARLTITDIDPTRAARLAGEVGATVVAPDRILATECDVLAPCALGAVIDDHTVPALRCRILAGGANNVLARPRHADALAAAGILFVPDYVANAGGLILLVGNWLGHEAQRTRAKVLAVGATTTAVLEVARADGTNTLRAAARMAEQRIEARRGTTPGFVNPA